jgi:hypothetical protein
MRKLTVTFQNFANAHKNTSKRTQCLIAAVQKRTGVWRCMEERRFYTDPRCSLNDVGTENSQTLTRMNSEQTTSNERSVVNNVLRKVSKETV